MSNNPIIVFEGIETSGKSTCLKKAIKYLKKNKIKHISFREPGGTNLSEKLRQLMLNKKSKLNNKTDLFLLMASRSENFDKILKENYKKKVILIDRFIDSTIAYQHYGMGINKKLIINLNKTILNNIKPSFTFLNIVNTKNLKYRLKSRSNKNRYDNFNIKFYKKVQKGYIKLSKNKKNYMIVNSNNAIGDNKKIIIKKINSILSI